MKRYNTLGELLIDYRNLNNISQSDFAARMDVDIRTVQRWEKNITLLKSDKEAELVEESFLPHQLIRNLNATNPIPTYYDFRIRKYSLSEITNDLPDISWVKHKMDHTSEQLAPLNIDEDLPHISRYIDYQYEDQNIIKQQVLRQAILLFPNLNLHLTDTLGFYAGHCIILSINEETYLKLKNKEISNSQIKINDLVDYRTINKPIFYGYNITADSNTNAFYILGAILKFFRDASFDDYLFCTFTNRHDSALLNEHIGLKLVWEEKGKNSMIFTDNMNQFYEGNIDKFLLKSI
jgi:transcriptional regulator with XRE-family HTH domain